MDGYSQTPLKERLEALRSLIPEAFAEGNIDWEKLKAALGEEVNFSNERYVLNWAGKSDAFRIMQQPSAATLVPCKEESVDFDNTENIFIEGENMEVLKVLQKSYFGKVKMIYIDPPYNTGNDSFIYPDKFSETKEEYQKRVGDKDAEGYMVRDGMFQKNSRENGQYHSNWLNMMMPRLYLAKSLLRDDGVIFVSIDDNEVHNLRLLMNEIFGEENFVAAFPWRKRTAKSDVPFGISQDYEWIVCFAKTDSFVASIENDNRKYYETPDFPNRPWRFHDMTTQRSAIERPNCFFTIINPKNGNEYPANPNRVWANNEETFQEYYRQNRIIFPGDYDFLNLSKPVIRYWKEDDEEKAGENFGRVTVSTKLPEDIGMSQDGTKEMTDLFGAKVFSYPKPTALLAYLLKIATKSEDLILDFFAGSGTTAHAVMQLNKEDGGHRKFICVQLPEPCDEKSEAYKAGYNTIAEISKERIRRAGRKVASDQEIVTSDQLAVASDWKLETGNWKLTTKKWSEISKSLTDEEIKQYGCKELQRTRCLAKINGSGQASLFDCEETAQGGNICSIGPNEESGSIDCVKHSGGTRAELIGGICPVYLHSTGFAGGIGDTNSVMREHRLSETRGDSGNSSTVGGNRQDAECPCKGTLQCPIVSGQLSVASGQEIVASGQLSVTSSQKLKTENWKLTTDAGFKVFKLQDSNFKPWRNIPGANKEEWKQQIIDFINPVAENATVENMMYELLLKSGKSLNSKIEHADNCYCINGGELALLLESVSQATVDAVLSRHPQKVIALDKLFEGNDQLKTNTALQMRDAGVEFKTI